MAGPLIDPESRWLEEPSADGDLRRTVTGTVLVTPDVDITSGSVIRSLWTIVMERKKQDLEVITI